MHRFELFGQGCEILDALVFPHGFVRTEQRESRYPSILGGGEVVVRGGFVRANRRLDLEFWFALRRVVYRVDDLWLDHESYMRALAVPVASNAYPGFSDDALDGFRHLSSDLVRFAGEFFDGDAAVLRQAAAEEAARQPERDRRYQAWMVGDDLARRRARELFHNRQFGDVGRILGSLQYPEFMDEYERQILDVSRRRAE